MSDLSADMIDALIWALRQKGMITDGDLVAAADWLDAQSKPDAAHAMRCTLLDWGEGEDDPEPSSPVGRKGPALRLICG